MKRYSSHPLHWASLTASAALTATALFITAPIIRAQSPEPSPTAHDSSQDIFDAIKKGADKLQKQAKDAGKIEPQLKELETRQTEYIKHQLEMEHRLEAVLIKQEEELHRLADVVERLETEIKAAHAPHPLLPPPAPPAPPAGAPAAPLPATEPSATPSAP